MKKTILSALAALALISPLHTQAQVSDVSVIVSPTAGYTFWNNQLNVGNSTFYGARVGFGFGPILELRANYERSFDLKGKLQGARWNVANEFVNKLENSAITYERMGGDLKLNLWNNARLTPYVIGGAGVLKFHYDDVVQAGRRVHEEQLYGNVGAGLKINFTPRVAFSLEARNLFFNASPNSPYTATESNKTLQNWSALASLDFYLGGAPAAKDEVSRAYRQTFSGGFRGLRFVAEPSAAYLNFRENSNFGDSWLVGVSAGVDFTTLVGVRGFYYRATNTPGALSTKLNGGLNIYGGNLITRLNVPRGVTPYLSLGAGYLNVDDKYSNNDPRFVNAKSGWFALGGGGLEVPLHRVVSAFGSAEAMLMEQDNPKLTDASSPSSINVNWMYRFGLRFNLGLKAKNGSAVYQRMIEAERERVLVKESLQQKSQESKTTTNTTATEHTDVVKTNKEEVVAQSISTVDTNNEVQTVADTVAVKTPVLTSTSRLTVLTEEQLSRIVQRVLQATQQNQVQTNASFNSMSDFDKILLILALRNGTVPQQVLPQVQSQQPKNTNVKTGKEVNYQQQIQQLQKQIQQLQQQVLQQSKVQKVEVSPTSTEVTVAPASSTTPANSAADTPATSTPAAPSKTAQ